MDNIRYCYMILFYCYFIDMNQHYQSFSSSHHRTHPLLIWLELLTIVISSHWRSALLTPHWWSSWLTTHTSIVFNCVSESSPERRYIVTVHGPLWIFWSFVVRNILVGSSSSWQLQGFLTAVGVQHVDTWSGWRRSDKFIDHFKRLLKIKSVFLFDFQHSNEKRSYFLSKFCFYAL